MRCDACTKWTTERKTVYEDGSEVFTYRHLSGNGHCEVLNLNTSPDFGCTSFVEGAEHVRIARKTGAPWQHSFAGSCPDCGGKGNAGDGGCHRCAGTGLVRHYDDGYIGEERTRLHPKERELGLASKPKCANCSKEIEPLWKACPFCGGKLEPPAEVEKVTDPLFQRGEAK